MSLLDTLLAKLNGVKQTGSGWTARCPAHDDQRASLSVTRAQDGRILVKCHAGCCVESVLREVGLTLSDLFPTGNSVPVNPGPSQNGNHKPKGRTFVTPDAAIDSMVDKHGQPSRVWKYHDENGTHVGSTVRWDLDEGKKDIRPICRHGDVWRIEAMPAPRPLYRLPDLNNADLVLVTEGEKAADAARSIGFTATTSAGGSQAASKSDWTPLAGKQVWLLPDNDDAGWKYAEEIIDIVMRLTPAPTVRIITLPDLPEKGDIVDWIEAHGDAAEPSRMRAEIEAMALEVEPEQSEAEDGLRFRPFPVAVLPELIREVVVDNAKDIGCDPSYIALPLLVAIAGAIGDTRRLQIKDTWLAPAVLWSAVIGESGTAKTPAFQAALWPVKKRQEAAFRDYEKAMKQYEEDFKKWNPEEGPPPVQPTCVRYLVSDTTVEALAPILRENPRGLFLARDELAGWLGSFDRYSKGKGKVDESQWLSMHSGAEILVDRKQGRESIYIPRAAVCVTGGIQPGVLKRVLGTQHQESGLAARILWAYPPRKPKAWTESNVDQNQGRKFGRLFERLYQLKSEKDSEGEWQPVLVGMTTQAKQTYINYFKTHQSEQLNLTGELAAAWSKLEEYAARLALVMHFARWAAGDKDPIDSNKLDLVSMEAGITLAKWFKHEARRIHAMFTESESERRQRELLEWIERKGRPVTHREAQQSCRWLKTADDARAALAQLVKEGKGSWREKRPGSDGGRASRVFVLTSAVSTVYETSTTCKPEGSSVDVDVVDSVDKVNFDFDDPKDFTSSGNTLDDTTKIEQGKLFADDTGGLGPYAQVSRGDGQRGKTGVRSTSSREEHTMASVSNDSNGRRRILFVAPDGSRKTIRLGKIARKNAESICRHVEALLGAKIAGQPIPRDTAAWLTEVGQQLRDKLAAVGLVEAPKQAVLGDFLQSYILSRPDVKPATLEVWQQPCRNLTEFFGKDKPLREITPGDGDQFKAWLLTQNLAQATVAKRLSFARTFLHTVCKHKFIDENPFAQVKIPQANVSARQHFVGRDVLEKLLATADPTWRTILALARLGGLRCPSEVLSIEWRHVDWERSHLTVASPKTDRYDGKGSRTIPLFADLRPHLEEAFELATPDQTHVVGGGHLAKAQGPNGWKSCNLRTPFSKLVQRAGLEPWPRLFHNLRASRETELLEEFPVHVVAGWMGHDAKVSLKHYAQTTSDHFERAIGGAKSGARVAQNPAQQRIVNNSEDQKAESESEADKQLVTSGCESLRDAAKAKIGEGGIRTPGTLSVHGISSAAQSATLSPLQIL